MNHQEKLLTFYKVIYSERSIQPMAARIVAEETERMIIATKQLFYAMEIHKLLHFDNADMSAVSFAMTVHGLLGIVALLSYTVAVVFSPLDYPGYNWMAQAVSDLSASNAPSLGLWNQLSSLYNICTLICAMMVCAGIQGKGSRLLRTGQELPESKYNFALYNLFHKFRLYNLHFPHCKDCNCLLLHLHCYRLFLRHSYPSPTLLFHNPRFHIQVQVPVIRQFLRHSLFLN